MTSNELPVLRNTLPVEVGPFTNSELRKAINSLKDGKATKGGDIPCECFKAFLEEPGPALQWIFDLCDRSWDTKEVLGEGSTAPAALIYKKGDPAECDNYRPISLINIA